MIVIAPLLAGTVPLLTLPGWPEAPAVPVLENLVWILFLPLAVFVLIALIHLAASRGKEDPSLHPPTEPVRLASGGPRHQALPSGEERGQAKGSTAH